MIPHDEQLNILKQELTILATKIGGTVDILWKVRGLSLTLWTAAFTVGVGNFSIDKQPIIALLAMTAFLPLLFLFVDAKNNQWYRRLSERESEIQKFLNDPEYKLRRPTDQLHFSRLLSKANIFPCLRSRWRCDLR